MTFEARDSAAKVVPARFKISGGRSRSSGAGSRRTTSKQIFRKKTVSSPFKFYVQLRRISWCDEICILICWTFTRLSEGSSRSPLPKAHKFISPISHRLQFRLTAYQNRCLSCRPSVLRWELQREKRIEIKLRNRLLHQSFRNKICWWKL